MPLIVVILPGLVKCKVGRWNSGGREGDMNWIWPPPEGGEPRFRISH